MDVGIGATSSLEASFVVFSDSIVSADFVGSAGVGVVAGGRGMDVDEATLLIEAEGAMDGLEPSKPNCKGNLIDGSGKSGHHDRAHGSVVQQPVNPFPWHS